MANEVVLFDPTLPAGTKFKSAAVRAEIAAVVPLNLPPDSVTGDKLADGTIPGAKMANGAITSGKIGAGEILTTNIGDGQVTAAKLAALSLTLAAVGAGVMGVKDSDGNALTMTALRITQSAYAALTVVDPNTFYLVVAG